MARLKWITPRSTLTISNVEEAHDTEQGKFSVFPALRVEMEPKNPADLHTCTSCPVQPHDTVRDGKIWRAQHRTGELQFKICLKDVTENLFSPQEAKPCCPYQRLCQKGQTPCDYQSSMPLQALCLHLLECPLDSASSSPSYDNPTQTLHLLLKFQFLVSQLKLSWPPSVGRWERRMTMSFV